MDNVEGTQGVPLTVFGGAVPELAPEDLPEGASPFNQDVDYNPGSVFTRAGRQNQYTYFGLVLTHNCTVATSTSDALNEVAWSSPNNATSGTPGTDTTVNLGVQTPIDLLATSNGIDNHIGGSFPSTYSLTTGANNDLAVGTLSTNGGFGLSAGWTTGDRLTSVTSTSQHLTAASGIVASAGTLVSLTYSSGGAGTPIPGCLFLVRTTGTIVSVQTFGASNGGAGNVPNFQPSSNVSSAGAQGSSWFVINVAGATGSAAAVSATVTDNFGNIYNQVGGNQGVVSGVPTQTWYSLYFFSSTVTPGTKPLITVAASPNAGPISANCGEVQGLIGVAGGLISQQLQCNSYKFTLASNQQILGMQVLIQGKQSSADPNAKITVSLLPNIAALGAAPITFTGQLSTSGSEAVTTFGTTLQNWGVNLTPAIVNAAGFGVQVQATTVSTLQSVAISAVQIRLYATPSPAANFNYIKTYEQTDGEIDTLALDANGVLWDEDVDSNPTVFNSIFTGILPNTFAKSVTFSDIEYIAFSNLQNGTDIPRQWNGVNLDRISMVGPGAQPSIASSGGSGGNLTSIQNITQTPQVQIRRLAWGASSNAINDSTPGNLILVFGEGRTPANIYQTLAPYGPGLGPTLGAGTSVVLSNITNPFPPAVWNLNGTYTVTQVTTGIVGGNETCPLFTIPAPATEYGRSSDFGSGGTPTSGWFYQSCIATMTMQQPLPNVGAGSSIQVTATGGSPPSGYDGTWTVLQALNASSMTINSCQLTGGKAIYSFTVVAGSSAPTVGQLVTTANCLNSSGIATPGVFNVTNSAIQSISGSTFTINIGQPDIPFQNQVGNVPQATANVGGTMFTFDAGAIVGTKTGGSVVGQGQVGVGTRKACVSFLTRSGFITQPSPIATFNVTSGQGSITVSNIPTGPPNVVARIISFTGANGGNFFYIPQEVDVTVGGVTQFNNSTIINDNTTTTQTFTFSDAVLLSATAIDNPGNNLFNTIELGSCRGLLTYSSRIFAWSEQQKITNLRNLSFDGGTVSVTTPLAPLGWTLDSTNGAGGSLVFNSPVFGWCYQILNNTGITQSSYGMITQNAWQDEFGVPIVQANTTYSVRITAQCQPANMSGNLVVDLFSATFGVLGTFSIPLASLTTTMQIYTGTLLTTVLTTATLGSKDLVLRVWAQNIQTGATVLIDRVEPFPTLTPVNTTAFKASYANNQEAFDLLTGVCGPAQNMQPINGGMVLFDLLYALKERSWYSTFDNGVTEPYKWNWKEVSEKVGTIGIHSYDWGEGWALTANREGVFFFEGGEPIKVSQEIQPLWDLINWTYGYTIWLRNDPEQRRFTVGVPIATPNIYMPEFPANTNPTSPNVVLMCNYRELNTGAAIAQTGPIRSTYMGRLMSPEPARKWSFWNIACPYSDYIDRANNLWPQFFCTGYGDSKIFQLQASALNDDGNAINSFWISYGFVKPEMQDAKGLGLWRMEFPYFTVLATGTGTLNAYVYPESPQNQPYVLEAQPLPAITQGDLEVGVNVKGQRFFVRIGTNAVGAGFRCSKMVVPLIPDPWSPIRGSNLVSA